MVASGSGTSLLQLNSTSVYIIGYEKLASKVEPKWFLDVTDTSEQYQLKKRGNLSGLVKQRLYFLFFFGETAKFPALQKVTLIENLGHCQKYHTALYFIGNCGVDSKAGISPYFHNIVPP